MEDEVPDLQEVLGISDSISKRDFGRERGNCEVVESLLVQ